MRETIERRTCDCCGKVAEHDPTSFGGLPYIGWQEILRAEPPFSRETLDACSTECAIQLLTSGPPLTVPPPFDQLVKREHPGWSQTEPSGYVAKYPTTGEPLATPEVGTISASPPEGECGCLPGGPYYWSDANRAFKCCACHKIISALKGVPNPTPMSKRP